MSTTLKGLNEGGYGGYTLTDQLMYNIKWWLDWGMIHAGAYNTFVLTDVESALQPVFDERYNDGQVWEGFGREWVWETDAQVPSGMVEPARVSGVYVNSIFYPTGTIGTYAFHVDYQNARIIFEQPRNSGTDVVEATYTNRSIYVADADESAFRTLMLGADEEFLDGSEPTTTPSKEFQAWLPSVFIQLDGGTQRGLMLGGGQTKTRIITLYVFAETPSDRNMLMDWLDFQSRSAFFMADLNRIIFPFDQYGDVVAGTTNWVDLKDGDPGLKIRITNGKMTRLDSLNSNLFRGRVQWEIEVDIGNI